MAVGNRPARIPIETFLNDRADRISTQMYRAGYELIHRFSENWQESRNAFQFLRLTGSFVGTNVGTPNASGFATRSLSGFDNIENSAFDMQTDVVVASRPDRSSTIQWSASSSPSSSSTGTLPPPTDPSPGSTSFTPTPTSAARHPFRDLVHIRTTTCRSTSRRGPIFDVLLASSVGVRLDPLWERDEEPLTGNVRRDQSFTNFAPRAGLLYQPVPIFAAYFNYSQSFQPAAGTNPDGEGFKPVKGEGLELGAKLDPLKGRLLATLALYQITKQNVLNPDPLRVNFQVQTGQERSRGLELEVQGTILPGWNVIGAYAWTDARVTKDTNPARVGREKPNVPEHAASLWSRYTIQGGALKGLGFGGGVFYVGEQPGRSARLLPVARVSPPRCRDLLPVPALLHPAQLPEHHRHDVLRERRVALEHLSGCAIQHDRDPRRPLLRRVACSRP